ncbi:hypothetical protein O6H91_23G056800 [Diphasiastrum complanatum]|uniref:Uncharacterized protein n=1 Tax=Diphasiastrum complanatum TaxID=34168 RepID=A0ACC2AB56_DIPCM|nr:hypothetical protein O6H91_23G056800 [Diphasiastrum complanatum]
MVNLITATSQTRPSFSRPPTLQQPLKQLLHVHHRCSAGTHQLPTDSQHRWDSIIPKQRTPRKRSAALFRSDHLKYRSALKFQTPSKEMQKTTSGQMDETFTDNYNIRTLAQSDFQPLSIPLP